MNLDFLLEGKSTPEYWNNEAVLFSAQDQLSDYLPSSDELVNYFAGSFSKGAWAQPLDVRINASLINTDGVNQQLISVDIETARNCYINGFSLCFGDLSSDIVRISELKMKAAELFGYTDLIAVTGYLSPPKAVGVLHFDRQHNFFIQKEGTKRWFVSEKAGIINPHENLVYTGLAQSFFEDMKTRGYNISLPRDCGKVSYELNPGDILYVPPGFYHSPETLSETSLHYTLTIEPACFWKEFNNQMFSRLLSSNGKYFADYRFLSVDERSKLIESCFSSVVKTLD